MCGKLQVYNKDLREGSHVVKKVSNTEDELTEAGQPGALPHT